MNADRITIEDLEIFLRVGVPEEERAKPQRLLISVEMEYDFSEAAKTDALRHTIDYKAVADRLERFAHERSRKLIETVAMEMAEVVLHEFKPARVTLEIKKFILPQAKHVAVRVTRPIS